MTSFPEDLRLHLGLTNAPPLPFPPEVWHGKPVAAVIAFWAGPEEDGPAALEPLGRWGHVVGAHLRPMPYPVLAP